MPITWGTLLSIGCGAFPLVHGEEELRVLMGSSPGSVEVCGRELPQGLCGPRVFLLPVLASENIAGSQTP